MRKTIGYLSILGVLCFATSVRSDVVAFYDFNDASKPDVVVDITGNGNNGEVVDAEYSGDKQGRTGEAGDRAMDFGDFDNFAYVDLSEAAENGGFDSLTETIK